MQAQSASFTENITEEAADSWQAYSVRHVLWLKYGACDMPAYTLRFLNSSTTYVQRSARSYSAIYSMVGGGIQSGPKQIHRKDKPIVTPGAAEAERKA